VVFHPAGSTVYIDWAEIWHGRVYHLFPLTCQFMAVVGGCGHRGGFSVLMFSSCIGCVCQSVNRSSLSTSSEHLPYLGHRFRLSLIIRIIITVLSSFSTYWCIAYCFIVCSLRLLLISMVWLYQWDRRKCIWHMHCIHTMRLAALCPAQPIYSIDFLQLLQFIVSSLFNGRIQQSFFHNLSAGWRPVKTCFIYLPK